MPRLKAGCYKAESLLEYISLPEQVGMFQTFQIRRHLKGCADCRKIEVRVRSECAAYFAPEPEITTSLLRVYSKLQKDETLILKGWKLDTRQAPTTRQTLVNGGWLFRGGLALASLVVVGLVVFNSGNNEDSDRLARRQQEPKPPMAQIRIEQPGRVKVHYVEPELLQTMEFETTSARY